MDINVRDSVGTNATYYYDQGNRLSRVKNQRGENFDFSYDNANRLTQIVRPGTKTSFDFDDGDFLTKISHGKVTSVEAVSFFIYVKDPAENRTQMKTKSGNFDYSYDSNNQVVGATNPEASLNEFFQYDSIGNRTKDANGDIEYDSSKQRIQEDALFTYTHDNNGNLSSRISKTSDESVNYTHNSENQLIRIEFFKGATKVKEVTYTYDALGRRIEKAVSDIQTPAKSFVRRFDYDGNEIIAERDGNEQTLARYTHSTLRTDDVLSVENPSGSFMYLKDGQGTITDITDSSGNLIQHYTYSSFGKILKITDAQGNDITSNPIINTLFTYTGREYDSESGLYYYRARYYDASMGRFLEIDPDAGKLPFPATVTNKYSYVANNPLNILDPSGKKFFKEISSYFNGSGGWKTDFITGVATVGVLMACGVGIGYATLAVGATILGTAASAGIMSLYSGGSFSDNFHKIFRISCTFLASSAGVHALNGSKVTAGVNSLFQGYVEGSNPLFGYSGGLTLGPASSFSGSSSSGNSIAGGSMLAHEFGHTLQFFGDSALAGYFAPSDSVTWAYGGYILSNLPGVFNNTNASEKMISALGSSFN